MKAAFRNVVLTVGTLDKGDHVVDGGLEDLEVAAKIESQDAGLCEQPVLAFLGVFGVAEGIGDDQAADAVGLEELDRALNERNEEIPLFLESLIPAVRENGAALELVPFALLVSANVGRVADNNTKAVLDFGKEVAGIEKGRGHCGRRRCCGISPRGRSAFCLLLEVSSLCFHGGQYPTPVDVDLVFDKIFNFSLKALFFNGITHEEVLSPSEVGEGFEERVFELEQVVVALDLAGRTDECVGGDKLEVEVGSEGTP